MTVIEQMFSNNKRSSWKLLETSARMLSEPQTFPNLKDCTSFESLQGRKLTGAFSSMVRGRAPHVCGQTEKSYAPNWFLSSLLCNWLHQVNNMWGLREHEIQMVPLVHTNCGVTLQFANTISHPSNALFQTILLIFQVTYFTAIVIAVSLCMLDS
jgi:hypothetical protein